MNRRSLLALTLILAAVMLSSLPGAADMHYVSLSGGHTPPFTNWPTAATNIQAAIDAAVSNDTVLVTNGVYDTGSTITVRFTPTLVTISNAVSVRSVNGPDSTVIVGAGPLGEGAVRCAYVGDGARLEGFTLTNGHTAIAGPYDTAGGGVLCGSSGVVSNCIIVGNASDSFGGGACDGHIQSCVVYSNWAGYAGGGVCAGYVDDCFVYGNGAYQAGGGVSFGTVTVSTISGNWAGVGGGMDYLVAQRSTIVGNRAFDGGGAYGCRIEDCIVFGNSATNSGGAAYRGSLANATVVGNSAGHSGGGVFEGYFTNSIVYFNAAPSSSSNHIGHAVDSCTVPHQFGHQSISNDPQFVDLSITNLRLKSTSPCIDAGTNLAWMAGTTDLDGLPRIINGTVDMGAYESPSPAITSISPPTPSDGPVITWASFTGAQYAVYGSTNFTYGYDILLQDGISALPPANSYTDTASGVALRGYAVGFEGKNGAE